jgi:WD40 repeat protein/beta-lactamase regulating signal transducer with metallopeptidase domain
VGSLVEIGMANALLAGLLATVALLVGRYSRRPALIHSLWLLVLLKLVTPPLVPLPIPWLAGPTPEPVVVVIPPPPEPDEPEITQVALAPPPAPAAEILPAPATMRIEQLIPDKEGMKPIPPLSESPKVAPPVAAAQVQPAVQPLPPPPLAALPVKAPEKVAVAPADEKVEAEASLWPSISRFVVVVWLVGAVVWYLRVAWRVFCFHRLLRYARKAPESLQQEAERLAAQVGLRRCPGLWLVPGPVPPLLWAVGGRARVFFPESLLRHLEEPGRSTLLVHELAHLRRGDHLVRWVELIVAGLYWWYPLVWLACRQLQAAEEECCDAWVVSELPGYGAAYAGALLDTVEFLSRRPAPLPPVATGFGRMHHLKRRLAMIVHGHTPRGLSRTGKLLFLALFATLPLVPTRAAPGEPQTIEVPGDSPAKPKRPPIVAATTAELEEPSNYLNHPRNLQGGGGQVWATAVSPDGKLLAVVAGGVGNNVGTLTLWDLATGKEKMTWSEIKPIRCVSFSPDGKTLATGDFNNKIQIRDPRTGAVRRVLEEHTGAINSVAFTPDSKTLVSGSLDNSIKLWNVADGKLTKTIDGHSDWVLSVAVSPDGKTLASASKDRTARVWDLPSGKLRQTLKGHTSWVEAVSFAPDNQTLATAGHDNVIKLWNAETGALLHTLEGHTGEVNGVVFFAEGAKLLSCSHDRTLRIWNVAAGSLDSLIETGHEEIIYGLSITPDGKQFVSGSWDKVVKVWDAGTHEEKLALRAKRFGPENDYPVSSVACSPDGKTLAVAGEERAIKLIDPKTGGIKHLLEGHEDIVAQVRFSPDGKTLASAGFDGAVILWDTASGKRRHTLKGHDNWVFCVAFSHDGAMLASGGYDRTVRLWDVKSGKLLETLKKHKGGVRALAFSRQGDLLASSGGDKAIRILDVKTHEERYTLKGHDEPVRALSFSPDGKLLVSGAEDNTVRLWSVADEKQLALHRCNDVVRDLCFSPRGASLAVVGQDRSLRILDPQTLSLRNNFSAHGDAVASVAYSADAGFLYTGSADRTVRQWQAAREARRPVAAFPGPGHQMWFSLFSPDGKWLATGGDDRVLTVQQANLGQMLGGLEGLNSTVYGMAVSPDGKTLALGCQDMTIKLADTATRKVKSILKGHKFRVWAVAFSPDGKRLASAAGSWEMASEPGEVKVWDLASGKEEKSLGDHAAPVQTVAWSKDGKWLATGSRDGLAKIFDAATGKEKHILRSHNDAVRSVAFDSDGTYLATGGVDGKVCVHEVATGKEIAALKASASGVNCIAFSPDGRTLAATSKPTDKPEPGEVRLWQRHQDEHGAVRFTEKTVLKGHTSWVLAVAFSPDGKSLASAGGTYEQFGEVIVWDVETGRLKMLLSGHRQWVESVAFGKDGKTLFSAGGARDSRGEVRCWQVAGAGWVMENAHGRSVCCAAWSPDGKTLATGSFDKSIKLWNVATGKVEKTFAAHDGNLRCLAFRPDGSMLASAGQDRTVKLWYLKEDKDPVELDQHRRFVVGLAWSPDGKLLATASADPFWRNQDGEVKVFEVDKGRELTAAEWSNRPAMSVVFSRDGKRLITSVAGTDALRVYNVETRKQERVVEGASAIRMVALSGDGKLLATTHGPGGARGNGSIQVWDTTTWKEKTTLIGHNIMCLGVGFSTDGKWLASASVDGTVKLFALKTPPAGAGGSGARAAAK